MPVEKIANACFQAFFAFLNSEFDLTLDHTSWFFNSCKHYTMKSPLKFKVMIWL